MLAINRIRSMVKRSDKLADQLEELAQIMLEAGYPMTRWWLEQAASDIRIGRDYIVQAGDELAEGK